MSIANKVFTNTAWQIALRSIEIVLGVITLGLITRYLGQVGFGYYTTVNAFLQLFIIIIDFGLYLTLLREISARSESETEKITNNIFTIRLLSSLLCLILAIVVVFITPYPLPIKIGVAIFSISMLTSSLVSTLTALFQKNLQMKIIAWVNLVSRALVLGCVLVVIQKNLGIQALFVSASLVSLLSFFYIWYSLRSLHTPIRLSLAFDFNYWHEVFKKTWPLAVTTALNLIYFKADTVILSIFQDQRSVGLYGASYRVIEVVTTFPHMFMGIILPMLTAAWIAGNTEQLKKIWERTFVFFSFLTLPMVAGTVVFARPIMTLIAGKEFETSGLILRILIIATAAIFFGTLYTYMVLVISQQRAMIKYFAITAVGSVVLYLTTIPFYSYWGAAWVTVASEVSIVVGAWLVTRQHVRLAIPWLTLGKLILASVLMATCLWFLSQAGFMLIPLIFLGAVMYGFLCLVLRAVTIDELRHLIRP